MKRVLLTGINGTVAQVLQKELSAKYEVSGLSVVRMDDVLRGLREPTWKEQLDAFKERVMAQLTAALRGQDAVAHLGWNTSDENWRGGLDPLNIAVVDCVYRAAIAAGVPRIYMASSVHAYDYNKAMQQDAEPIAPFPDTRTNPFGVPPTSLYGVSKRWMEIAGQYYAMQLKAQQKILVVRLGAVGPDDKPHRAGSRSRLWDSHRDCAGLLAAFIECGAEAPSFWVAFGVSDNCGGPFPRPLFASANPYGFRPADNSFDAGEPAPERAATR